MFTNVAHRQQSHHFPCLSQYLEQGHYKDAPTAPFLVNATHNDNRHATLDEVYRQRLQKPQQYAYPLRKQSPSFGQESSFNSYNNNKPDITEHMLRRKTPNGTLAAGYDGRPVEWMVRPHAVKHFLMPSSDATEDARYKSLPASNTASHASVPKARSLATRNEKQGQASLDSFIEKNHHVNTTLAALLRPNMYPSASIDSILDQGSLSRYYGKLADDKCDSTVLQPMWPPSSGLTSLNGPGPYGSYSPYAAFVPYRPVPFQDPLSPHQIGNINASGAPCMQPPFACRDQWASTSNHANYRRDPLRRNLSSTSTEELVAKNLTLDPMLNTKFSSNHETCEFQPYQSPLAPRSTPCLIKDFSEQQELPWDSPSEISALNYSTAPSAQFQNSSPESGQAQFKDKILNWARRVYVSLLASLQQAQRDVSDGHHYNDRRLQFSIYPKPPKQTSINPSRYYVSMTHDRDFSQHQPVVSNQCEGGTFHHQESFGYSKGTHDGFLEEHNNYAQLSISPCQNQGTSLPLRSNGRYYSGLYTSDSDSSLRPFVSQTLSSRPEVSPSIAATTAMEILDRLCQESNWEWTDGILLGGCLAYGLGDHTKAIKWYMRVLSCDPKYVPLCWL